MLFNWLKQRRRQRILAEPIPPDWLEILQQRYALYRYLDGNEQEQLLAAVRVFVAEKTFEGCKGLEVTDEMRLLIAAQACLLTLGVPSLHFDNVQTVLLYPQPFRVRDQQVIAPGLAIEGDSERLGEAHYRGPIVISWPNAHDGAVRPGFGENLVMHEFAHQLDMLTGEADGVPPLPRALRKRWQRVMAREYEQLCAAADAGEQVLIDPYGAGEPSEFFAVVTEQFFDGPLELRQEHQDLYGLYSDFYRADPAAWFERMS